VFKDSGHRPHADHRNERPKNPITHGPESITVTLDTWGPQHNLYPALYDALQSNWGDAPSRAVDRDLIYRYPSLPISQIVTGVDKLSLSELAYVESCFAGQTLQQVLERLTFSFTIDGVSRACTHQLVRTRLGAGFMQHGGRDNDWRHRAWTMPETIRRACNTDDGEKNCITDWEPIEILENDNGKSLYTIIEDYLQTGRDIYATLVDAGIPWQDARRLLWMGTQTYIHADYNYLALKGVIGKRGEPIMDWEINCVAQLMLREVTMHCPPMFSTYLMSLSDAAGKDQMAGLESWTPTGKYPNPFERCECGHAKANHIPYREALDCEVCTRELKSHCTKYRPIDTLTRTHRPEQNPFWILSPESMAGAPVRWIPTNGVWPEGVK